MSNPRITTTDAEIEEAITRAADFEGEPRIVSVHYEPAPLDLFVLQFKSGTREIIQREKLQGLANATPAQLANIEIGPFGTDLCWPELDVDHYLPHLLQGVYGTKKWMANLRKQNWTNQENAEKDEQQNNLHPQHSLKRPPDVTPRTASVSHRAFTP